MFGFFILNVNILRVLHDFIVFVYHIFKKRNDLFAMLNDKNLKWMWFE